MDYSKKKLIELKNIGSQRNIKNCMCMGKSKLISMLEANDKDSTVLGDAEFDEKCREYVSTWRQNNPERNMGYRDKFRESMRLNYHKKKQAAEENFELGRKHYENMTVHELKYIGRNRKIKYCNAMHKVKLIKMLKINDEDPSVKSDPEFDKQCREEVLKSVGNIEKRLRVVGKKFKMNNQVFIFEKSDQVFILVMEKGQRSTFSF